MTNHLEYKGRKIITALPTHGNFMDLTGDRFERLLVVEYYGKIGGHHYWACECDCKKQLAVSTGHLRSGLNKSCGCYRADSMKTHGKRYTAEYKAWISLIQRCTNPKNGHFNRYGGRGIKVCERWRASFENFFADMGEKPSPKHSVDRYPNNDGDYEPGNCRWADNLTQARNRLQAKLTDHQREQIVKLCPDYIARRSAANELGLPYHAIKNTLYYLKKQKKRMNDGAEDSNCPVGRGATEKEAVGDLIDKVEEA